MKQNIGNNKEKTLNTKTLLKMRIELENIYESKGKKVDIKNRKCYYKYMKYYIKFYNKNFKGEK